MGYLGFLPRAVLAVMILWGAAAAAQDRATLERLVTTAKKEGAIEFYGPSTLGPQGTQQLLAVFNKKYGLSITMSFSPAGNMVRDVAKVVTAGAAGIAPEWDLMVLLDTQHATLSLRKAHQTFDYTKLGVDPKFVHYAAGAVSFATQTALPAYNKSVLPAKDVPTSWEDLLDPKWKGGKLGVSVATHHLARLAVGAWGEEKGTNFVKALAEQKPILGNPGELHNRLAIGEILIYVNEIDSFIHGAKVGGAPLVFAERVEPIIFSAYHAGVPKGARHPNVGHLFAAFLTTPEAQSIWEAHTGQSSPFVPGTMTYKFAQGKKMVFLKDEQAETVERLAGEYAKILGFR